MLSSIQCAVLRVVHGARREQTAWLAASCAPCPHMPETGNRDAAALHRDARKLPPCLLRVLVAGSLSQHLGHAQGADAHPPCAGNQNLRGGRQGWPCIQFASRTDCWERQGRF